MNAKELERQYSYRQLLGYNTKLKSDLINLRHDYNILKKYQDGIVKKEVETRTQELRDKINDLEKNHEKEINDKNAQIEALKKELAKQASIINNDSNNSGIPTSKTPIGIEKRIPNTREATNKLKGGQIGHPKHKLHKFKDEEVTEFLQVLSPCPSCGDKDIKITGKYRSKDETDYDVKLIKRRYCFHDCKCNKCGSYFSTSIPNRLKEENQYGLTVQSLAVCLTNEIYTPFNKTVKLVSGITNNEINLSEGFVAKLQKRASNNLSAFISELKEQFPKEKVYGWDDTVIKIDKKEACLRVYCTSKLSLFTAHNNKNADSLESDGILSKTTRATTVVHDHLLHNYNQKFSFNNSECYRHLNTRLEKLSEDTTHKWNEELMSLLKEVNDKRNELIAIGIDCFSSEYLDNIYIRYESILSEGRLQNDKDPDNFFSDKEITLLKDLKKYKENYLWWCNDFDVPSTNNNSERNLRPVKSKQKISCQFINLESAICYANIHSYISTCKRYGINIIMACERLMDDNPFTLKELEDYSSSL